MKLIAPPLLLNNARQLALENAVNLTFLNANAKRFVVTFFANANRHFFGFRFAQRHFFAVTLLKPRICTPAAVFTAVRKASYSFSAAHHFAGKGTYVNLIFLHIFCGRGKTCQFCNGSIETVIPRGVGFSTVT